MKMSIHKLLKALVMFIVAFSVAQTGINKEKVYVRLDGSSKGTVNEALITEIEFYFTLHGEMEYSEASSYSSFFIYKVKNLSGRYTLNKTVKVKEPRDGCPHDIASKYNQSGGYTINGLTDTELTIDYGAGIQKNALEMMRKMVPENIDIPKIDVPPGVYTFDISASAIKEIIEGIRYVVIDDQCIEMPSSFEINLGDVNFGCKMNEDGSMTGEKQWSGSYTGNVTHFDLKGCEDERSPEPKRKNDIAYQLKWTISNEIDCKAKVMKALATAKEDYGPGAYTKMFCLVNRLFEDQEPAFLVTLTDYNAIDSIRKADILLRRLQTDNRDELRNELVKLCRSYEGEALMRALDLLHQHIDRFYSVKLKDAEMHDKMNPAQVYFKEQLVRMSQNDKHFLNCYIEAD